MNLQLVKSEKGKSMEQLHIQMEQPVYYWDPSISPSGICFYNSDSIPEWKGNLFVACLSGSLVARLII